jgi:hypothetical protein
MNIFDIAIDPKLIADVTGVIALALGIASYQFKSGRAMLVMQAAMNLFWSVHYFLIGAKVGGAVCMIGGVRNVLGGILPQKYMIPLAIISATTSVSISLMIFDSWMFLTACAGNVVNTTSIIVRHRPALFRTVQLVGGTLWLIYSALVLSVPGVIFGIFLLCSNCVGLWRHERAAGRAFWEKLRGGKND